MSLRPARLRAAVKLLPRDESGITIVLAISMMTPSSCCSAPSPPSEATCRSRAAIRTASRPTPRPRQASAYYLYHLDQDNSYWLEVHERPRTKRGRTQPCQPGLERLGHRPAQLAHDHGLDRASTRSSCFRPRASRLRAERRALDARPLERHVPHPRHRPLGNAKRSIVATFKRKGFLDYLYFTDYETLDPYAYSDSRLASADASGQLHHVPLPGPATPPTAPRSASSRATRSRGRSTRTTPCSSAAARPSAAPRRTASSRPGPTPGGGTRAAAVRPELRRHVEAQRAEPAAAGVELLAGNVRAARLSLHRHHHDRLNGAEHDRHERQPLPTTQTVAFPSNGVIYVKNGSCGTSYKRKQTVQRPGRLRQRVPERDLLAGPHDRKRERHHRQAAGEQSDGDVIAPATRCWA